MPVTPLASLANNDALIRRVLPCVTKDERPAGLSQAGCWLANQERINTRPDRGTPGALSRTAGRPNSALTKSPSPDSF